MKALPREIKKAAVTVSPTLAQAERIEEAGFDVLQVHGSLDKEILSKVHIPIIRAVNVKDRVPLFEEHPRISAYLFDAAAPGSGKSFDWACLERFLPGAEIYPGRRFDTFQRGRRHQKGPSLDGGRFFRCGI